MLKVNIKKCLLSLVFLISCQTSFALTATEQGSTDKFLSIADIHFTPFTSCKTIQFKACALITQLIKSDYKDWDSVLAKNENQDLSAYGQDTNYPLLKSSLDEIAKMNADVKPRFTLILGDFLAHNYREQYILYSRDYTQAGYNRFVKKTIQFLTAEIRKAIPTGDIYPVLGNNDSYTGDYSVIPQGDFLKDTTKTWSSLIKNASNLQSFQKQFPVAGYYSVTSPDNKRLRILILDTVLFSSSAPNKKDNSAADQELQWLTKELTESTKQNQRVILALHIPIGVDVYRTLQNAFGGINEFWQPEFTSAFQEKLQEFPGTVIALLPGHIHMDTFQMLSLNKVEDVPVSYTPSISPIFGNNPAFKVYSYDPETLLIKNFDTYYFPLNDTGKGWLKEYSFRTAYKNNCTDCDLKSMLKSLTAKLVLTDTYKKLYAVGENSQPIKNQKNWQHYWCDMQAINATDFKACVKM